MAYDIVAYGIVAYDIVDYDIVAYAIVAYNIVVRHTRWHPPSAARLRRHRVRCVINFQVYSLLFSERITIFFK